MATRDSNATREETQPAPWSGSRSKGIICKSGPAEVLDSCLMHLSAEMDIEQVPTLAEGMRRCLVGGVDILFVNFFSVTAREMTALAAFRSMLPGQPVVAITESDLKSALLVADLADEVLEVNRAGRPATRFVQPRA